MGIVRPFKSKKLKKLVLTNEAPTLTDFFLPSSATAVKINLTTMRRGGKRQASTFLNLEMHIEITRIKTNALFENIAFVPNFRPSFLLLIIRHVSKGEELEEGEKEG